LKGVPNEKFTPQESVFAVIVSLFDFLLPD
jgi:hypothetical protein